MKKELSFQEICEFLEIENVDFNTLDIEELRDKFIKEVSKSEIVKKTEFAKRLKEPLNDGKRKLKEEKKSRIEKAKKEGRSDEEISLIEDEYKDKNLEVTNEIDSEFSREVDELHEQLELYVEGVKSSDDVATILCHYAKVKVHNVKAKNVKLPTDNGPVSLEKMRKNKLCNEISSIFETVESTREYLGSLNLSKEEIFIKDSNMSGNLEELKNISDKVDIEKADMSRYSYIPSYRVRKEGDGVPDIKYSLSLKNEPELFVKDDKNNMEVYIFGNFKYGRNINSEGKSTFNYGSNIITDSTLGCIVGIIRNDENGNPVTYYGVINLNYMADKEFYTDVAFSNVMLKNAQQNNYGFIGSVLNEYGEDGKYAGNKLCFNGIGDSDLVTALSFAMNNNGKSNIHGIRNLQDTFKYIDNKLLNKIKESDIRGNEAQDASEGR